MKEEEEERNISLFILQWMADGLLGLSGSRACKMERHTQSTEMRSPTCACVGRGDATTRNLQMEDSNVKVRRKTENDVLVKQSICR